MKITFVNKYYWPPHLGGVEQSLNLLATSLAAECHDVVALVANESNATEIEVLDEVRVERHRRLIAMASTPIAPGLPRAIHHHADSDVIHLQFPYPWGDISWLLAESRVPTVMTYHADVVKQKRLMRVYAPVLRRVLQRVDRIIVGAPQIIEHSPFLAPHAEKCDVVPFAIDPRRFADVSDERAEELRASIDGPIVLFVGRLVYYKGVEVLVRAMAEVEATLVVIGQGPLGESLRQLADELGIAERVQWLEPVDNAELGAWYRAADVSVLPSVAKTEAYGLVQLESHLAGTPVVSTDLPSGVPFVNKHEETGLIVPPGDASAMAEAINRLLADDELRTRMGERARQRANTEFSVDAMVRGTLDVYSNVVAR